MGLIFYRYPMKVLRLSFLVFSSLLLSSGLLRAEELVVAGYKISVQALGEHPGAFRTLRSELQILRAGKKLLELRGGSFVPGTRSVDPAQLKFTKPGTDVNGNGIPDLVVAEYTDGGDCCMTLHVFELGKKFRKLATIDTRFDLEPQFLEIPGSSARGYRTHDYTFGGWGGEGFSVPAPTVYLRFTNDGVVLDVSRMKKAAPSDEVLRERAQVALRALSKIEASHSGQDLPLALINPVLELIYSGNAELLPRFLEWSWPPGRGGRQEFLSAVQRQLQKSPYAKWLATSNLGANQPAI
ncbi:MAG: hypothetical protein J0M12_02200 [Deltaproteobacteria bacterium]|nr:hypothetical protein [Deltaproteobacteria bacterium]